jgi:hypothetical protein
LREEVSALWTSQVLFGPLSLSQLPLSFSHGAGVVVVLVVSDELKLKS